MRNPWNFLARRPRAAALLTVAALVSSAAAQTAQSAIQWMNQPAPAAQAAQKSLRPVLVYVAPDAELRDSNIQNRLQRSLRDPIVVEMIQTRFVPLRMSRTSQTRPMLQALGLPANFGGYMAVVPGQALLSPETSAKVNTINLMEMAEPGALLTELHKGYREYVSRLYTDQIKAKFEEEKPKPADLTRALELVAQLNISEADADILKLIDRRAEDKQFLKNATEVLGILSTRPAADYLLKQAKEGNKDAQAALGRLTPTIAAEVLLPEMRAAKEGDRLMAYKALSKIFDLKPVRPDKWWERVKDKARDDELQSITTRVNEQARVWQDGAGRFR